MNNNDNKVNANMCPHIEELSVSKLCLIMTKFNKI